MTKEILGVPAERLEALAGLPAPILEWYGKHARSMPWRDNPQPYWVWVSEIMLQQTRVEAVREYFARFVEALPTVEALAAAGEDRLLKLWEGLGYYNRVRNLQKAAVVICREHGGKLPSTYEKLLKLPGIGDYTAGAIASIAFGVPEPVVDGNVYRVLARLTGSRGDITRTPVKRAFREVAASLVPADRPGDYNQAVMELGATVCLPNGAPLCPGCPVGDLCVVRGSPAALELPVKAADKPRRREQRTLVFVVAGGRALLFQREKKGLLPGMYQPLNWEGHMSREEAAAAVEELGGRIRRIHTLRSARHVFSHVEWEMNAYLACADPFPSGEGIWADQEALEERIALPSAFSAYTPQLPRWLEEGE